MAERVHHRASKFPFVFMGLLSLLTMNRPAMSQLPTTTILGAVKDSSGGVVPDAAITERKFDKGGRHGESVQPSSSR